MVTKENCVPTVYSSRDLCPEFSDENSACGGPGAGHVIAVVGPMAAGKNYICSQMEKDGWSSVDADILVHAAIEIAKDRILETFSSYAQERSIDRRELGRLLFAIPELLTVQEAIVYPIITTQIKDFIESHEKVIINATVLYKTPEILNLCEEIIYVTAPLFTRIRRARHRDNLSYKQIFRRFWAQRNLFSEYKKTAKPLKIIKNR